MKVGLIGQENDLKTANSKKFLDYLTNAEAASPPKTTANQDKEPAHSTTIDSEQEDTSEDKIVWQG